MQSNNDDFLTVDEAAELVGLSHWTIRRMLGDRLTRYKSGARTVVSRAELLELMRPKIEQPTQKMGEQA